MNPEHYVTLTLILAPILATPGPANLSFFAIGCAGGVRRSLPFFVGVNLAVTLWAVFVFWGGSAIVSAPWFPRSLMQSVGAVYMAYLGFTLLSSRVDATKTSASYIPGFKSGFFLQIVNPKLFALILLVLSQIPPLNSIQLLILTTYFLAMNVIPHLSYLALGHFGGGMGSIETRNMLSGIMLISIATWMLVTGLIDS